jgi:hypothetical protein
MCSSILETRRISKQLKSRRQQIFWLHSLPLSRKISWCAYGDTVSNCRIITDYGVKQNVQGNGRSLIYLGITWRDWENRDKPIIIIKSPDRDLKRVLHGYKSEGLMLQPNLLGKFAPVLNYLSTTPWKRMVEWRYSSTILDFGTVVGEWLASRSGSFTSGDRAPGNSNGNRYY